MVIDVIRLIAVRSHHSVLKYWRGMVDNLNEKENEGETDESEKVEWS